jgi:hypothetical protein
MPSEQQIRDAVDRFLAQLRQDMDTRLEALAAELLQFAREDQASGIVPVERAAIEVARAVGRGGVHARHDLISRVVGAVRKLDEATTLRGVLDALADGAAAETVRSAVLLVDGEWLRSYRHHGYDRAAAPEDLRADASMLLASVVDSKMTAPLEPPTARTERSRPPFLRVLPGRVGLAMPLVLAQQVVAIVFAEGAARQPHEPGEPVWTEQVEVLVRHASGRLENVTSSRTVEVLSNPSSTE